MTMTSTKHLRVIILLAASLFAFTVAQSQSNVSLKDKALALLKRNLRPAGLNQSQLNNFLVSDAYIDSRSGNFLVYLQQLHNGIPVYNKISVYIFNKKDTLVQKTNDFIRRIPESTARVAGPRVDAATAVRFAAAHLSIPIKQSPLLIRKDMLLNRFVYRVADLGSDSTPANLVWLPVNDSTLKLAWNVRITSPDKRGDWFVRIDAQTGDWLDQNSLIVDETGNTDCGPATTSATSAQQQITQSSRCV